MAVHQLIDYYKILEVSSDANAEEVKKAYRKLALKYHPDTNTENDYDGHYFSQVQEAYSVLGNEIKRLRYDEECWLAGMANRSLQSEQITPDWILKEAINLNQHMASVDVFRMSHSALKDYVFQLLNDSHMALLAEKEERSVNEGIVRMLLGSVTGLKYEYLLPVTERLFLLANDDTTLKLAIDEMLKDRKRRVLWERCLPYVIGLVTLLIVLCMYFWVAK